MWYPRDVLSVITNSVLRKVADSLRYLHLPSFILLGALFPTANATEISVSVSNANPSVGDSVDVYFTISGLTSAPANSLSAFDFDILFDDTVLSFINASFDDPVLGNQLDLPEASAFPFDGGVFDLGSGLLDAYGLSGNSDSVLDADQADQFRFLGLSFTAIAAGSVSALIDLSDPFLAVLDSGFSDLIVDYAPSQVDFTVSSGVAGVPEPGSLLLLAIGTPMLWGGIRKYRKD